MTDSERAEQRAEAMRRFQLLKSLNGDDPRRAELRSALIEDHLPYARHIALRYGGHGELTDDFVQVAYLALVAMDSYTTASLDRPLRAEPGSPSLLDLLGAEDERLAAAVDRTALKPLIAALDERDRSILMMHFFQGMTQREIGTQLGYSQMHISRLLSSVLSRLRAALC